MPLLQPVISFAIRQAVGEAGVAVTTAVEGWFRDNSQLVPKALGRAAERSWQAIGVALGSDKLLTRITGFFKSGDEKAYREQVREFLRTAPLPPEMQTDAFRRTCHAEWKRAEGPVQGDGVECDPLAAEADGWERFTDPNDMIAGATRAVARVADVLGTDFPNLARLLREPTPAGPPLLAAAFAYFFRREVETTPELARGLTLDTLNHLVADQAARFEALDTTLAGLGDQTAAILGELGEVHALVTDIRSDVGEMKDVQLDIQSDVRRIGARIDSMLDRLHLKAELKPGDSVSIRSEGERWAVRQLLDEIRNLPAEAVARVPDVLNGLGKLQVGIGDFDTATGLFRQAASAADDPLRKAEAHFNAYRASLEKQDFPAALAGIAEAARLAPKRFAPFPVKRYEPKRILGAGGFGTVFLCDDRRLGRQVAIKALHADDFDRGTEELFAEARILHDLNHPAVIRVLDAEYADPEDEARPYLVMEYFPGQTLAAAVGAAGMPLDAFLPVATQIAVGVHAAHQRGILHRDLKPENVLVRLENGAWQVKIIDFGLALRKSAVETRSISRDQSIQGGSVAGTLRYAPPEQLGRLAGVRTGPYSDVFAFGKLCCYCLFKTTEPKRRHWETVSDSVNWVIERCIEEELADRLPDFDTVLNLLAPYGSRLGIRELATRLQSQFERDVATARAKLEKEKKQHTERELEAEERRRRETEEAERVQRELEEQGRKQAEEDHRRRQAAKAAWEKMELARIGKEAARIARAKQQAEERKRREETAGVRILKPGDTPVNPFTCSVCKTDLALTDPKWFGSTVNCPACSKQTAALRHAETTFTSTCPACLFEALFDASKHGEPVTCPNCKRGYVAFRHSMGATMPAAPAAPTPSAQPRGTNIRITCPTCNETLELSEQYVGQEVECGACFRTFIARPTDGSDNSDLNTDEFELTSDEPDKTTPSPLTVYCPHCAARLRVPTEYVGRNVRCRKCQGTFATPLRGRLAVKPATRAKAEKKHRTERELKEAGDHSAKEQTCPGFVVFECDYRTGRNRDPEDQAYYDFDQIERSMREVLTGPRNYFGVIDQFGVTLQFMANADGSVQVDVPDRTRKGSMTKDASLEECVRLVLSAGPSLAELVIPGLVFEPWE
jgi:predicted Zn finger-like uncharacterized protein